MSYDDTSKMPLYHVQLETKYRIISYEIGTENFDAVEEAKIHLSQRLIEGEDYINVGGNSKIGYVQKEKHAQIFEAKVTTGQPFKEDEE
tara:strand:- start:404 stop:670 length:267 start_codon:yes stop_codon:yes gene_type:complete